jgi:predicted GNAT family acetyltransferase
MTRPADSLPLPRPPAIPGLRIRPAGPDDLDELCPLQEAYEREEVLTPIHSFDPEGSRASLARSLRDQVIVEGRLDGVAVAKAATNARAFRLDQVGGVFVAPPYRRRGIGTAVVMGLLAALEAQGRGTVLFVKRGNEAAKALYDSLAYTVQGGYRADYFIP